MTDSGVDAGGEPVGDAATGDGGNVDAATDHAPASATDGAASDAAQSMGRDSGCGCAIPEDGGASSLALTALAAALIAAARGRRRADR
jgi:MYXO-CTERM domain-containing protein